MKFLVLLLSEKVCDYDPAPLSFPLGTVFKSPSPQNPRAKRMKKLPIEHVIVAVSGSFSEIEEEIQEAFESLELEKEKMPETVKNVDSEVTFVSKFCSILAYFSFI